MRFPEEAGGGGRPAALQALRVSTAARHDEIERVLQLDRIDSLPRLVAVLQVFDAFLSAWEPRVLGALPAPMAAWFAQHRRGAWARDDLRVLGAERLAPAALADLALESPAGAVGSLYVLEGSALGGRLIARALHQRLGITESGGARFFGGRGGETGRIWREFCEQADRQLGDDAAAIDQACRAADRSFASLTRCFRERLAAPG